MVLYKRRSDLNNDNGMTRLELGSEMTHFGLKFIMHNIFVYNLILSHKGSKSMKIVRLPKIAQKYKFF